MASKPNKSSAHLNLLTNTDVSRTWIETSGQYYYPWDPLGELIQNSVRFIHKRIDGTTERGLIRIEVDFDKKVFSVWDDGIGFSDMKNLAMWRSEHEDITHSGYGIGLSSVIAQSERFHVESVHEGMFQMVEYRKIRSKLNKARKENNAGRKREFDYNKFMPTKYESRKSSGERGAYTPMFKQAFDIS